MSEQSPTKPIYKICVLGRGSVGKSCLLIQFVNGYFEPEYDPTIEDDYQKLVKFNNKAIILHLIDTAGEADILSIRDRRIAESDGFLIIYAINDQVSFEGTEEFYNSIIQKKGEKAIIMLCGNKIDLEMKRKISTQEGQELAQYWGVSFMETSALSNYNVENMFMEITKKIDEEKEKNKPQETPKKQSFFEKHCNLL